MDHSSPLSHTPWLGYPLDLADSPHWVELSPAVLDTIDEPDGLREACPTIQQVSVELVAPDESGLPWDAELRALQGEEQLLEELLSKHARGSQLVLRLTGGGTRHLMLALATPGLADYALRKWSRKLEREVEVASDPRDWGYLDAYLMPGPTEWTWLGAGQWALVLQESGSREGQLTLEYTESLTAELQVALERRGHGCPQPHQSQIVLEAVPGRVVEELDWVRSLLAEQDIELHSWG